MRMRKTKEEAEEEDESMEDDGKDDETDSDVDNGDDDYVQVDGREQPQSSLPRPDLL